MPSETPRARCVGYGPFDGRCPRAAGSSHSNLWCQRCDDLRRASIDRQLEQIEAWFAVRVDAEREWMLDLLGSLYLAVEGAEVSDLEDVVSEAKRLLQAHGRLSGEEGA